MASSLRTDDAKRPLSVPLSRPVSLDSDNVSSPPYSSLLLFPLLFFSSFFFFGMKGVVLFARHVGFLCWKL